jgi:hypothetical protein
LHYETLKKTCQYRMLQSVLFKTLNRLFYSVIILLVLNLIQFYYSFKL